MRAGVVALLALVACEPTGTAPTQLRPKPPPLEQVDFGLIDSGKVMFNRYGGSVGGVYLIDANAQESRSVLDSVPGLIFEPIISPSGTQAAVRLWTDVDAAFDVYTSNLSGSTRQRLSTLAGNIEGTPAWTASGSAVLFYVAGADLGLRGIYQHNLSGSASRVRPFVADPDGTVRCPNGSRAIAVSEQGSFANLCGNGIYSGAAVAGTIALRYEVTAVNVILYSPAWSPDATEIAFLELTRGTGNSMTTALRTLTVATGAVRTVATVVGASDNLFSFNPYSTCWLPGGIKLVFNAPLQAPGATNATAASIYVVNADGSELARLTTNPTAFDHSVSCAR